MPEFLSDIATNLLKNVITWDVEKRFDIYKILSHEFFKKYHKTTNT
jgi:hypothetical protein